MEPPSDTSYATYVEGIVKDENNDRSQLYLDTAKQQGKFLEIVERNYAKQWADRAYPGEYIQNADGKWIKK